METPGKFNGFYWKFILVHLELHTPPPNFKNLNYAFLTFRNCKNFSYYSPTRNSKRILSPLPKFRYREGGGSDILVWSRLGAIPLSYNLYMLVYVLFYISSQACTSTVQHKEVIYLHLKQLTTKKSHKSQTV